MIPLAKAQNIASFIVEQLRPYSHRIEIAGSIRRQRPEVSDIDLVIDPLDRVGLEKRIATKCRFDVAGDEYIRALMPDRTQIDIWFSHTPQKDLFGHDTKPDNFGSLLLSKTGSKEHNIVLCQRAERLGRHWNPSWGVYERGRCLASKTEVDIYNALGLEFIEPVAREFTTRSEQLRFLRREVAA